MKELPINLNCMIKFLILEILYFNYLRRGNPWIGGREEGIDSRIKLLSLLDCLTRFGWKLYASIDMSKGHEGRDTDTWFFRRDI